MPIVAPVITNIRVAPMDMHSAGEIGGVSAGLLVAGRYFLKFLNWATALADRRRLEEDKRQNRREAALDRRDNDYRVRLEGRLERLEAEQEEQGRHLADALAVLQMTRVALGEVTLELEQHAPQSIAIRHAQALLHPTFRSTLLTPSPTSAELSRLAREVDERIAKS